jgi:hypothetical protein
MYFFWWKPSPVKVKWNCHWWKIGLSDLICPKHGLGCNFCRSFKLDTKPLRHKRAPLTPCQRFIEKDKPGFGCLHQGPHCHNCATYIPQQ